MEKSLTDIVGARLDGLEREMKKGERVMVKIVELCTCNTPKLSDHQTKCSTCGGSGFWIDAQTYKRD